MRDREQIDSELRRIAVWRQSIRDQGRQPSSREVDELLDELLAHSTGVRYPETVKAAEALFVPETWLHEKRTTTLLRRRQSVLRRVGLFGALPLSLIAVVAVVVVTFGVSHRDSSSQSAEAQPTEAPPSAAPPNSVGPTTQMLQTAIVDAAFVGALKHAGVPVPSQEYATAKGHAVCDFLTHQPNVADTVKFVQRSTIWDADQSTNVIAGAIVAYCPQSQPSVAAGTQPAYQDAQSNLQAIEGKLKGIEGDLDGIQGSLDGILPGHQ